MSKQEHSQIMKILMIGDSSVGKSALLTRYVDNKFTPSFITTIGIDFKIMPIATKNGTKVKLQVWDTAGQERFRTITTAYYRGAQGIILMYDITQADTFKNIAHWKRTLDQHATKNIKLLLVGNKADLTHLRQVTTEEGAEQAKKLGMQFIEVSAKEDMNVKEAFSLIIEELMTIKKPIDTPSIIPIVPIQKLKKCC